MTVDQVHPSVAGAAFEVVISQFSEQVRGYNHPIIISNRFDPTLATQLISRRPLLVTFPMNVMIRAHHGYQA